MWNVTVGADKIPTQAPGLVIKKQAFMRQGERIEVHFGEHLRRVVENGKVVEDNPELPEGFKLKSLEDYASAIAYVKFVGESGDYIDELKGTTKKQRDRSLRRLIKQSQIVVEETSTAA